MSAIIDGNVYPIQFRLHDNRSPNSPKAILVGGGFYRSDLLSLGEFAFDPINYIVSVGVDAQRGLSAISGDLNSNLRVDKTPLRDKRGHHIRYNHIGTLTKRILEVGAQSVRCTNYIGVKNPAGSLIVSVGHGHMHSLVAMLFNIRDMLTMLDADTLTNNDISKLFDPPANLSKLTANFGEIYGNSGNLLLNSELYTTDTLDSQSVTNLALRSRDIDVAAYGHVGVSSNKDVTVSPRGDSLADEIIESTSNSAHSIAQNITGVIANEPITFHRKVKAKGRTHYRLSVGAPFVTPSGATALFNLSGAGSVIGVTGGATARIIGLENGWYWIAFTPTGNNSASSVLFTENLLDDSDNVSYLGDGVSGVFLDELQAEIGLIANPVVDTTTIQVTATVKRVTLASQTTANFDKKLSMSKLSSAIFDNLLNGVYLRKTATITAGFKYCVSAILRKGTSPVSTLELTFTGGATPAQNGVLTIDWNTLEVTMVGSTSAWQGGLIPMPNGCYRLWVSGPSFDHTTLVTNIYVKDKTATHTLAESVYVGSIMANAGYYPEPYIRRDAV